MSNNLWKGCTHLGKGIRHCAYVDKVTVDSSEVALKTDEMESRPCHCHMYLYTELVYATPTHEVLRLYTTVGNTVY